VLLIISYSFNIENSLFIPEYSLNDRIKKSIEVKVEKEDLALVSLYFQNNKNISQKLKTTFINSLTTTSYQYNVPVYLLHSIIVSTSNYKFYLTHSDVFNHNNNEESMNGKGIACIAWCVWGDELKKEGIAENEDDLYLPEVSIRGCGFILKKLINEEKKKGNTGLLERVMSRYCGLYGVLYLERIKDIVYDQAIRKLEKEL
jgi:hypothetical protein